MEAITKFWSETMEIREARWIVVLSGLVICVAIAYYVVKLFRDMALGVSVDPSSYISDFQRLRDQGKLDDEEYAKLAKSIPKIIPGGVAETGGDELPDFEEQPEP
jgi:hypothetical protein